VSTPSLPDDDEFEELAGIPDAPPSAFNPEPLPVTRCDRCGKPIAMRILKGDRPDEIHVKGPQGASYLKSVVEHAGMPVDFIVLACSPACRDALFVAMDSRGADGKSRGKAR
jgi:hypothetical protein